MRAAGEVGSKMSLHVECTYLLSNVKEDSIITIVGDTIDTDDPAMFFPPFFTDYPRVKSEGIGIELLEARGLNKRDAISAYKKMGLFNLIDENFLLVLLTMPFWGMIARWHCRNKVNFFSNFLACSSLIAVSARSIRVKTSPIPKIRLAIRSG